MKAIRITFYIGLLFLFLLAGHYVFKTVTAEENEEQGDNHALIIGIGDYDNWRDLDASRKGAKELKKVLEEQYDFKPENIVLLTDDSDRKPTLDNIKKVLKEMIFDLKKTDNLLIYYSGHSRADNVTRDVYWIPKDGDKNKKSTWLEIQYVYQILGSDLFEAKNVFILAEANFPRKLLNVKYIPIGIDDLRYQERVRERSSMRSREVLAFGDSEPYVTQRSEGLGVFTYYLLKALKENKLKYIDFESILYDETVLNSIKKTAGTNYVHGRFKRSPDKGGQFVIERTASSILVNVTQASVSPSEGYEGDEFKFSAETNADAEEVYLDIDGRKYYMQGSGTKWSYSQKVDARGSTKFRIVAVNEEGREGRFGEGQVLAKKRPAKMIAMAATGVEPEKSFAGEEFEFTARTEKSAEGVVLMIGDKRYEMDGSGKSWALKMKIDEIGIMEYTVAALNEDGLEGSRKRGFFVTRPALVNILAVTASSETGYEGDEFVFKAETDRPADVVYVEMDDITYEMTGSGTEWEYRKKITDVGEKKITVVADNSEGSKGKPGESSFMVAKLPAPLADIAKVAVSPTEGYEGDDFMFRVQTTADAEKVYVEINGQRFAMKGSGTDWNFMKKVDVIGTTRFTVVALNEEGEKGSLQEGSVLTKKRPAKLVSITMSKVEPERGYAGEEYIFTAKTEKPTKSVALIMGEKRYEMEGSGMDWSLKRKIEDIGSVEYAVVALNEDNVEGSRRSGFFVTRAQLVNVLEVAATSETGYAGDEFVFKAKTDRPADVVFVEMEGITYQMTGFGTEWEYRKKLSVIGEKKFSVVASNVEGVKGVLGEGIFMVVKIPARLADIAKLASGPAEGMEGYAGDNFVFRAETTAVAREVYIEMDGQRFAMEGSGMDWSYTQKIDTIGFTKYRVTAVNEEGNKGRLMEGRIEVMKKAAGPIRLVTAEVEPRKGYVGGEYSFKARTERPAKGVTLIIGKDHYKMEGSGRDWSIMRKINTPGTSEFTMVALNQDDVEGEPKNNSFFVNEGRFVDNGDGTITDLESNMMWVQNGNVSWRSLTWEDAIEYARSFDLKGYKDWRLPTKEEWERLVDTTQRNPALPKEHPFENIVTAESYWSKTTHSFGPGYVWQVNLWNGKINYMNKKKLARVWPVRYSGFDEVSAKLSER